MVLVACSSTRKVPEGKYMLTKVEVRSDAKKTSFETYKPYIKQHSNVKILGGLKFHLWLYNLAGKDSSKNINKWLMKTGEAPVIYDDFLAHQSTEQLKTYMQNRGYYHSIVTDTLKTKGKKKLRVIYKIKSGPQFKVNGVDVKSEDKRLIQYLDDIEEGSYLKKGVPFDVAIHDAERERITTELKERGYFDFSKEFILFKADTTIGNYLVNDSIIITNAHDEISQDRDTVYKHPVYNIRNVYFRMGVDPHRLINDKQSYFKEFDTLVHKGLYFLYQNRLEVKPEVIVNSNFIQPGQIYQASLIKKTHNLLSSLQIYRFVNISFTEVEPPVGDLTGHKWIDCNVHLIPAKSQSYAIKVEGMNSSGNLGAGGNLTYQHKNIFRGAEVFNFSVGGSMQNQLTREGDDFSTVEFHAESRIIFPKFWMPFRIEGFRKKYNPKTSLSFSYNYQKRPDYIRTIANGKISYLWRGNRYTTHSFTPFGINYVVIPPGSIHQSFWEQIEGTYLQYSYQDHLIGGVAYSVVYNEQELDKRKNFWYANFNFNEGGNLFNLFSNMVGSKNEDGYYEVLGIRYAQFVKGDIDVRYHHYVNHINSMAYRFFCGVGYPYGNLKVLPFEERYFSGGANSIRAWPVRGLGPGSYYDEKLSYYNQVGDIKLEFNAEYRFKLFWMLEGALFLDVGNVYNIRDEESQPGGTFKFSNFTEKLAVGTGLGLRFDLKYFIFRLDTGLKLRDPVADKGLRWIPGSRAYSYDDVAFNFAIGYPF